MPTYHVTEIIDATNQRNNGTPIISRAGKPIWRVIVRIAEDADNLYTGFTPFEPDDRFLGPRRLILHENQWEGGLSHNFLLEDIVDHQQAAARAQRQTRLYEEDPARLATLRELRTEIEAASGSLHRMRNLLSSLA